MGTSDKSMQRLKKSSQHLRRDHAKSVLTLHHAEGAVTDSNAQSMLAFSVLSEPDARVFRYRKYKYVSFDTENRAFRGEELRRRLF